MNTPLSQSLYRWLDQRVPMGQIIGFLRSKTVPNHRGTFWYLFGGLTLFFFMMQMITGILLSLYYKPTPELAHDSILKIMSDVPYGWLVRSIHAWSANLMIGSLFVHMFSAFFMKAYRKPRELMWVSGVLLLFLVLGFGFTGYLLRWDTLGYFATLIGTEVPKTLPIIGDWGVSLLKGSDEVGGETLTRMHSIHVIILPLTTILVVSFHLLMNQTLGTSTPIGVPQNNRPIPFLPNFVYRDIIMWSVGMLALVFLAVLVPSELGEKADPLASAPAGIKPEWYFLPLYQSLRIVPSSLFSMNGEFIVNSLVGLMSLVWAVVPFIDRNASMGRKSRTFMVLGVLLIAYIVLTIILAYAT